VGKTKTPTRRPDSSLRPDKDHRDFVQNDNDLVFLRPLLVTLGNHVESTKAYFMKSQYLLLALLLAVSSSLEAKIPFQVKKSVAFIFAKDSSKRLIPQGTGFFVLLKDNQNADTTNFGYLVTTRNAITKQNGLFFDTVYIRINRKDGYSDTLTIPLVQNGMPRYFLHPDSAVDLAMVPAFPDGNRYDFLFTPVGMIAPLDFFKKENITEGDEVKITDFGIAKIIGGDVTDQMHKTRMGVQLGTPSYMSPEQFLGEEVDPRSDIYASGVMLYQLVTARLPFVADNLPQITLMHTQQSPVPPAEVSTDIPDKLSSIILKALAKKSSDRFHSAQEFRVALETL